MYLGLGQFATLADLFLEDGRGALFKIKYKLRPNLYTLLEQV